jgi:hypothetical protein
MIERSEIIPETGAQRRLSGIEDRLAGRPVRERVE